VVDEEHHRLVLLLGQGDEVKVVGDLDAGVLEPLGQGPQLFGGHDVTSLDGDHLVLVDCPDGHRPAS
jgi:hypothetical protein